MEIFISSVLVENKTIENRVRSGKKINREESEHSLSYLQQGNV